jgi:hypothetical protein
MDRSDPFDRLAIRIRAAIEKTSLEDESRDQWVQPFSWLGGPGKIGEEQETKRWHAERMRQYQRGA